MDKQMNTVDFLGIRIFIQNARTSNTTCLHTIVFPSISISIVLGLPSSHAWALCNRRRNMTMHIFILCKWVVVGIASNTALIIKHVPLAVDFQLVLFPDLIAKFIVVVGVSMATTTSPVSRRLACESLCLRVSNYCAMNKIRTWLIPQRSARAIRSTRKSRPWRFHPLWSKLWRNFRLCLRVKWRRARIVHASYTYCTTTGRLRC